MTDYGSDQILLIRLLFPGLEESDLFELTTSLSLFLLDWLRWARHVEPHPFLLLIPTREEVHIS